MTVAEIVADVQERGDEARARVGTRARRRRARARGAGRRAARRGRAALADRVRRWHEAQRPARPDARGRARRRARASLGAARLGRASTSRAGSSRRSSCAPCLRGPRASSASSSSRRREGAGLVAAAAELLGIDEVWAVGGAAGDRRARVRPTARRQDRRPGERVRQRGEARSSPATSRSTCPPARPRSSSCSAAAATARSPSSSSQRRREHGHDAVCEHRRGDDLDVALQSVDGSRRSTSCCSARRSRSPPRISNAGAVFVGATRRSRAATMRPAATTSFRPAAGRARSGGLGLETFLKPVTVQRLTPEGLALVRPTVEALAAVEGMTAHAAAVRAVRALARPSSSRTRGRRRRRSSRAAPGSIRSRSSASTATSPPLPLPTLAARRDRGGAREVNTYPHGGYPRARTRRSPTYAGVEPENVVLGAGADDLILLVARAFAGPGDTVAIAEAADVSALSRRGAARRRRPSATTIPC